MVCWKFYPQLSSVVFMVPLSIQTISTRFSLLPFSPLCFVAMITWILLCNISRFLSFTCVFLCLILFGCAELDDRLHYWCVWSWEMAFWGMQLDCFVLHLYLYCFMSLMNSVNHADLSTPCFKWRTWRWIGITMLHGWCTSVVQGWCYSCLIFD